MLLRYSDAPERLADCRQCIANSEGGVTTSSGVDDEWSHLHPALGSGITADSGSAREGCGWPLGDAYCVNVVLYREEPPSGILREPMDTSASSKIRSAPSPYLTLARSQLGP